MKCEKNIIFRANYYISTTCFARIIAYECEFDRLDVEGINIFDGDRRMFTLD